MDKKIATLALLLGIQVMAAAAMTYTGPDLSAAPTDTALIRPDKAAVEGITIEAPQGQKVVLARQGSAWILPDSHGFPADASQVESFLNRLKNLKHGPPLATTKEALDRFKVGADDFERRITLTASGKPLATLYLGSASGLRRAYGRSGTDKAVYALDLAAYEAPAEPSAWEDKSILQVARQDIAGIEVDGIELVPKPASAGTSAQPGAQKTAAKPEWQAQSGLAEDQNVNQKGVDDLAVRLAGLRFDSLLGTDAKPEYGLDAPLLRASLTLTSGKTLTYQIGKRKQGADYVLHRSDRPEYFALASYTAKPLLDAAQRDQLVSKEGGQDGKTAESRRVPAASAGKSG